MKKLICIISVILVITTSIIAQQNDFPTLTGPYLGQKPPGMIPEIFAPGIISTVSHEFSCCFSPDGNEFYFTRRHSGLNQTVIMICKIVDGVWAEPEVASFTKNEFTFEPFVTPDNKRLYFQSGRVIDGALQMFTLYVDRDENGDWGGIEDPGELFNPNKTMHIASTDSGTIYTTDISGGMGNETLGIIRKSGGIYQKLEKLGTPFNEEGQNQHPWIAPDESIVVYTVRRPGEEPNSVLFCSFRQRDGGWSKPLEITLGMRASQPFITADGKYLFFSSGERGKGDIYWVDAKIIACPEVLPAITLGNN